MNLSRRRLWTIIAIALPTLLVSGLLIMSLFSKRLDNLGLTEGQLRAYPSSPNCVCSSADSSDTEHAIEPLVIPEGLEQPLEKLVAVMESLPRATIVKREDSYLHVEFRSPWLRFVDDVEFQIVLEENLIHVRSASRIGHSDLGVNRRRVEQIRQQWQKLTTK
jgi:uncharacterized protein (DUF1499 family)